MGLPRVAADFSRIIVIAGLLGVILVASIHFRELPGALRRSQPQLPERGVTHVGWRTSVGREDRK